MRGPIGRRPRDKAGERGCAVIVLTAFFLHERRVPEPALDLALFRKRAFAVAVVAVVTVNFICVGTVGRHGARPVLVTGVPILVASGLLMVGQASTTMAIWLLVLATWLTNLGAFVAATDTSDTIVSHAPPGKAGSVAAVNPAFAMTGYAIGPTI